MDNALTQVTQTAGTHGVEFIGFSGGGAVAALLAARRQDTLSLRTVAGNLDHAAHSALHNVSPLSGSLNPPQDAARLRAIPQHHFTGAEDKNVTAAIYQSYAAALGQTPCLRHTIVPGAGHEKGWTAHWTSLLRSPINCNQ
jgi:pimeloyl-ACP methyl ester carboxylesterase